MPKSPEPYTTEGERARAWREACGFSRRELAAQTGYAESSIAAIERGQWKPGQPVDEATMQTYRLACAAVALGVTFDWLTVRLRPMAADIVVGPEAYLPPRKG
ncbi:helix-turn-helix domain-containing protein [Methylobacterium nodulans]|uniref:Transcriptional regulator, XRE family n=1 Tax=Methylobacterium nodulans (strain LMG 21967 / CNCM I-2342 / ORS 2060) TaxID=460265 RepID=B8IVF6_METNO|nr:helix-turn-helix transcriptional regulator [Methylobacterium nodulans]ACL61007.1 transcriptional regulator, XRE family [Methylobacterium nodulans ORS 2060]